MQNHGASNYDYSSVVEKLKELMIKGVLDKKYRVIKSLRNSGPIITSPSTPVQQLSPPKHHDEVIIIDDDVTNRSYDELPDNDFNLLDFSNTQVNQPVNTFDIGEPIMINFDESGFSTGTKHSNILDTSITELENFINEKYLETCKQKPEKQDTQGLSKSIHDDSIWVTTQVEIMALSRVLVIGNT